MVITYNPEAVTAASVVVYASVSAAAVSVAVGSAAGAAAGAGAAGAGVGAGSATAGGTSGVPSGSANWAKRLKLNMTMLWSMVEVLQIYSFMVYLGAVKSKLLSTIFEML